MLSTEYGVDTSTVRGALRVKAAVFRTGADTTALKLQSTRTIRQVALKQSVPKKGSDG